MFRYIIYLLILVLLGTAAVGCTTLEPQNKVESIEDVLFSRRTAQFYIDAPDDLYDYRFHVVNGSYIVYAATLTKDGKVLEEVLLNDGLWFHVQSTGPNSIMNDIGEEMAEKIINQMISRINDHSMQEYLQN